MKEFIQPDTAEIDLAFTHKPYMCVNASVRNTGMKRILHNVPVQLHLLHFLHKSEDSAFKVGLEANIIFQDQGFVHLHVNHLQKRGGHLFQNDCDESIKRFCQHQYRP